MSRKNGNNPLLNGAHNLAWDLILFLNGAGDKRVLNAEADQIIHEDPAEALYKTAKKIKAEAIDESGQRVDYASLSDTECYRQLRAITGGLSACQLEDLGDRNNQLAFWINLYNSLILDAIICFSIDNRVPFSLFHKAAYNVCGLRFSADDIEHGILRGNRSHPVFRLRPFAPDDPRQPAVIDPFDARIHFALNCGARSCPPITVYQGESINEQLEAAAASFINGGGVKLDRQRDRLVLSPIFKWYQSDFGGEEGVRRLLSKHRPGEENDFILNDQIRLTYEEYDWTVNQVVGG